VFDGEIVRYGEFDEASGMPGRAYIDLEPIWNQSVIQRDPESWYGTTTDADALEQTVATVDSGGQVRITIGANLVDYSPVLTGRVDKDNIVGTWRIPAGPEVLPHRGHFSMHRTAKTAAIDSARVRSRRGSRIWKRGEVFSEPGTPAETLKTEIPAPP
jgi:hypothetical protein